MSWKSLITAGLFCLLASPVFAVGPTMSVVKGGTVANSNLDANGNWVWKVQIAPDTTIQPDATGTPIAAELGFTSSKAGATAAVIGGGSFDTGNPGKKIFGTEPNSASTSNPALNFDGPIVVNGAGTTVSTSIGSANVTGGTARDYITITVPGPTLSSLSSTITASGAYGGNGRIAQINGGTSGGPYTIGTFDTFNGAFIRTATPGDTNLGGGVDLNDFNVVLQNFGIGQFWQQGNFHGNGTGVSDLNDFNAVLQNFGAPSGVGNAAGGLGASTVPEPATAGLLAIGIITLFAARRRK